jgi:hypothetical protein
VAADGGGGALFRRQSAKLAVRHPGSETMHEVALDRHLAMRCVSAQAKPSHRLWPDSASPLAYACALSPISLRASNCPKHLGNLV